MLKTLLQKKSDLFSEDFAIVFCYDLRELVLVHDRNPESMRTVPRVCAAGRDSVSGECGACLQKCLFFENSAPDRKIARNPDENVAGGHFFGPRNFSGFFDF
mgnify:CR=1 FL=1